MWGLSRLLISIKKKNNFSGVLFHIVPCESESRCSTGSVWDPFSTISDKQSNSFPPSEYHQKKVQHTCKHKWKPDLSKSLTKLTLALKSPASHLWYLQYPWNHSDPGFKSSSQFLHRNLPGQLADKYNCSSRWEKEFGKVIGGNQELNDSSWGLNPHHLPCCLLTEGDFSTTD